MSTETIPAGGQLYALGAITAAKQPDFPRGLDLTIGGTAGDINASTVTVYGTNFAGTAISEDFGLSEDAAEVLHGAKAFKTVTKVLVPAQDGAGVTLKLGVNDKLGLNEKLSVNAVLYAMLNGVLESTAPTVTVSSTVLESNTVDLFSALSGTVVKVGLWV
jgi:hypothetical protein